MFPAAVDLRPDLDQVYSQGYDGSCGPHALTACLDTMFERATGKQHRFDKAHLWKWAKFHNGILETTNTGTDVPSLCKALNVNGVVLGDKTITGFQMVSTRIRLTGIDHFKHLLCLGIPMVYVIRMPRNLASLTGDWRTHTMVLDTSGSQDQFHFVALVGYDDAAQRFLFENSWGDTWGDGGFFGVPYDQVGDPAMFCGLAHVDVAPVLNVPVEGYKVPAIMLTADKSAFVDRSTEALKVHLMAAFGQGVQSLVDTCIQWGVSDKHLEAMFGWPRGAVRAFKQDNPGIEWRGFVWDQL